MKDKPLPKEEAFLLSTFSELKKICNQSGEGAGEKDEKGNDGIIVRRFAGGWLLGE
ncbi:hypothetical protein [Brevibacillus fulvus]|uniref:Uncharacterized protein n=1 Tax=Brevibacillus fulvus TaxID=1125967 RepID=A0A938Y469_9BACL|nr:hypothetical protein [Brevibacillus fulvus]MBM7591282.1 hypothetical protein [Brevibacillus fulvus]